MTRKLAFLVTIGCVAALLALAGTAGAMSTTDSSSPTPWIVSDQSDYAPASTVHLTGGNWQPGEAVQIVTNDTIGNTWSRTDNVTADASGNIADDVVLPNTFISNYSVSATGAQSGTATSAFTDKDKPTVKFSPASPNPSVSGSSVTFTATVSGSSGTPTGSVTFGDGTTNLNSPTPLCSATLHTSGGATTATCTSSAVALGARTIVATYSGDGTYNGSGIDTMTQTVDPRAPSNLNATAKGQNEIDLTWPASPDAASITNYVIFEGTTKVTTLANTATSAAITGLAAGSTHSYTIVARFTDGTNTNFDSSAAGPASATTVPACTTPSVTTQPAGQSITYGASASFSVSDTGTPAPTVQWQASTDSGSTWSNLSDGTGSVSGSTGTTLTLTRPRVSASGNQYRAVLTNTCGSAATNGAKLSVTPASLGVTGITASSRVYDGTTGATLDTGNAALSGVIGGDAVGLDVSKAAGAFADKNVGTGKTVQVSGLALNGTDAGNYTLTEPTATADITKALITVTARHDSKSYDGTTTSAVAPMVSGDVAAGDTASFSQSFDTRSVGTGKTLAPSGLVLDGDSGNNYKVTFVGDTTGQITPASLGVTGITASSRVYDGTTGATLDTGNAALSGVIGGDAVGLDVSNAAGAFADKNVGTGKTVQVSGLALTGSDAGNYNLTATTTTADITRALITVTARHDSKSYDGTTSSAVAPMVSGDVAAGDTASFSQSFDTRSVGTGKTLAPSGLVLDGDSGNNYKVTFVGDTTGQITPASLGVTGITASSRVYDGTTGATIDASQAALNGTVYGNDSVGLDATGATGAFADKNVGTGKTVQVSGLALTGSDAGNYILTQPTTKADITPKGLTVTGITASSKTYDGDTTAKLDASGAQLKGVVSRDDVSLDATSAAGAFADKNVGTGKTVQVSGLALTGGDAGNYTVTQPAAMADITPKGLTVTGITASSKTYDGGTTATLDTSNAVLTDAVSGDKVSLDASGAVGAFADKNVGTGKTVEVSGLVLTGGDAGNYRLTQPTATADITPASVGVTGITASDKVYDGKTGATLDTSHAALSGTVYGSDSVGLNVTGAAGAFADKNVGTGKTVTISGLALNGTDAKNYTVTQPTTTADITPASLTGSFTAKDKVYDGTAAATVTGSSLAGVISPDDVSLQVSNATFDSKNAGNAKTVTANLSLSGNDAKNYTVNSSATTQASITRADLTVSGITANNKVWDGTKAATLNTSSAQLQGVIGSDAVTLNTSGATGTFASSAVGTWTVSVSGLTISGMDAGNYTLTQPTTTASITAWNGKGFSSPVGSANSIFTSASNSLPTPTSSTVWNSVKGGSTVPLKFNVYAGTVEQTSLSAFAGTAFALTGYSCPSTPLTDAVDFTTTGATSLRYDTTGMQWIQNWQTPKGSGKCYRATVTFADGSALSAFFTTS